MIELNFTEVLVEASHNESITSLCDAAIYMARKIIRNERKVIISITNSKKSWSCIRAGHNQEIFISSIPKGE